ncbi:hypothetical protein [Sporosarcina sp. NPDC096371]
MVVQIVADAINATDAAQAEIDVRLATNVVQLEIDVRLATKDL